MNASTAPTIIPCIISVVIVLLRRMANKRARVFVFFDILVTLFQLLIDVHDSKMK
jgi:hypothetical protein